MANIDNLNFKVIIDDKDFNKKIKELESLAQRFNTNMTTALNLRGGSQALTQQEVVGRRRALQAAVDEARAQERINREKIKTEGLQRRINEQIERGARGYKQQNNSISELSGLLMQYLSFRGMASLISSIVRITGEFEVQKATLGAMLNDLGAAEHLITRIKGLAVESPFTFKELTGYAKQLTAFGVPEEELFETTNMIADLSAGLGVAADRLILAYGQVRSAAFLRGQEVRQFTEAGIPILQELAEEFEKLEGRAVSVGEVFDRISARQVSFEMVAKVLREMTSEGGKFYNMQQIQTDTLWGKMQKLKDMWQIAMNEMGTKNNTVIHNTLDTLAKLISNWEKVGKVLRTIIITFGAYTAALAAAWVISKAVASINMAITFIKAMRAAQGLTAAISAANISLSGMLGFVGLLGGAIYALSTNSKYAEESTHDLNAELGNLHDKAVLLQHSFDADIKNLQSLTKGTQAYRDALEDINNTYGDYLPKLLTESSSYEEIAATAEKAKLAILEVQRQRAIDSMREQVSRIYEGEAENYSKVMKGLTESGHALFNHLIARGKILKDEIKVLHQSELFGVSWRHDPGDSPSITTEEFRRAVNYILLMQEEERKIVESIDRMYQSNNYSSIYEFNVAKAAETRKEAALKALKEEETSISEYREREKEITKNYYKELIDGFEKLKNYTLADKYRKELEEFENFLTSWRGKVQNLLQDKGYNESRAFGLWPTEYTSSTDFIDKLLKDYMEVSETLEKLHFDPNTEQSLKDQKKIIEAIADLLNIDLSTGKRKGLGKSSIERQIDALTALKKAYDDLKALNLSDATIVQMLKENFPDVVKTYGDNFIKTLDFSNRILKLAQELKKTERDKAINILKTLGLDNLSNDKKEIKDAINAAKKYFEAIRKWQTSDFGIEGEGVAFDIGKIANQLSTKFNEIDLEAKKIAETFNKIDLKDTKAVEAIKNTFEKEFGEGTWDAFYDEFVSKGEAAIEDFAKKQTDYERKLAQERLNDIAKKYVNESLEGIDMSHWGDKTLGQIDAIRQQLMELMSKDIELPESTITKLNDLGLSTEELKRKIAELFGMKLENVTTEKFKALSKVINDVAGMAKSLGGELEELGDTLGNDMVSNIGKSLQVFEELTKILTECDSLMKAVAKASSDSADETEEAAKSTEKAAEGMGNIAKSSDWVTMALKLVISVFSKVVDGITESQKALQEAREAAIEYANALKQLEYETMRQSYESIFGTDDYKQAIASFEKAKEYRKSIYEAIRVFREQVSLQNSGALLAFDSLSEGKTAEEIDALERLLGIGEIIVDARTEWQKFWGTGDDLIQKFNINDFLDEEGMLDGDKLSEWMKANSDNISEYNRNRLNEMLNDYDLYVQALEDTTTYISNIFGQVADDMASKFIEAFKTSGEAALDYAEIMDGVATEIAKSVIKSMLIENVFSPDKAKEVADLFLGGDTAGALAIVDEAMQAAQALTPEILALLEELKPYFKMEDEDKQSLSDGIKGITEDTANLLASYLNAIRADVSYSKTLWERMDATTQQIATVLAGFSAPTLIDYQKRIEANTYNIQMYTSQILLELQSVITSDGGGGSAVRILS